MFVGSWRPCCTWLITCWMLYGHKTVQDLLRGGSGRCASSAGDHCVPCICSESWRPECCARLAVAILLSETYQHQERLLSGELHLVPDICCQFMSQWRSEHSNSLLFLISHPPEARGLCFWPVLFSFFFFLVGLGPQSGGYCGSPGIFGDTGAGHARASGGWLPC